MNLDLSPEDRAFRDEIRSFVAENLSPATKRRVLEGLTVTKADSQDWQTILHDHGYGAPSWPLENGGTGWSSIRNYIFEDVLITGGAPGTNVFGTKLVGPVILAYGSDAQKAHYLPRILAGEDWWCQGYSEPNAGSDLASLKTKAERQGDTYRVNGIKTWTTDAQHADMIFCLVRTSSKGKRQKGISFLLIDMKSPGVTLRPIITIDGGDEINEVRFDDVVVPVESRVGEENKGWTYAKLLLSHERLMIADVPRSKRLLAQLKTIAGREQSGGRPLIEDVHFADRLAALEIELTALEFTTLRFIAATDAGDEPGPLVSLLKIRGSEVQQAITEATLEALGPHALPYTPEALIDGWNEDPIGPDYAAPVSPRYFNARKISIYSGSNEIQKNIMAKHLLGL